MCAPHTCYVHISNNRNGKKYFAIKYDWKLRLEIRQVQNNTRAIDRIERINNPVNLCIFG